MRSCPPEFQAELTRIGGVNQYYQPIFKLVWSEGERITVGGRWKNGFEGYKHAPAYPGEPCWCLTVWEPAEVCGGGYESWMRDFRDEETGLLQCGGYPKYGNYRLLQRFMHREIVQQAKEHHSLEWSPTLNMWRPRVQVLQKAELRTYRMEPNGFMLDVMLPMLMNWRRLSNAAKIAALKQQEQWRKDEHLKALKNAREGTRLSRTMRSGRLVQKRAEIIERGLRQAMARAAEWGLGMRMES
jgi:hypothetical protein